MKAKPYQIIAWSQLGGGIAGVVVLLPTIAFQNVARLGAAYYVLATTGFLFAAWAGWLLLRKKALGRELSLAVQVLQIVQITAAGWMVQYATGLQVLVKTGPGLFQVSPGVNAAVWFGPTILPVDWQIAVNLFALWASIYLGWKWIGYPSSASEAAVEIKEVASTSSGTA
jgi:hypothetical protein